MVSNKDIKEIKSRWGHIPLNEFLEEIERRAKIKIISRRDLLQLADVDWCLECGSNGGEDERKIEDNGYCWSCNNSGVRIESE